MLFRTKVLVFGGLAVAILSILSLLVANGVRPTLPPQSELFKQDAVKLDNLSFVPTEKNTLPTLTPDDSKVKETSSERNNVSSKINKAGSKSTKKGSKKKTAVLNYPLNLNRATKEELMLLPGIGEVLAQRIIDERERRGGFKSIDELLELKGIGEKKLSEIKPLVTLK